MEAVLRELTALLPIAHADAQRYLGAYGRGPVEVRQQAQRRVYRLLREPLAEADEWLGRFLAV